MERSKKVFVGKCVAIFSVIPLVIMGHSSGPPAAATGAPGEQTCWQAGCHRTTTNVNEGGGTVTLTASTGTSYTAGQKLTFTINVANDPTARVYGFEASVRDGNNNGVGSFTPGTGQAVVCADDSLRPSSGTCRSLPEYIEHSLPRSTGTINFDWTPPAQAAGDVTVYVAVNAANGNGNETGDHIYTKSLKLTPAVSNPNAPTISVLQNGATNIPGSAGQSGSYIAIKGTNFTTGTGTWNGPPSAIIDGVLPTELGGVQVKIGGKPAAIFFYSPTQLNVQVPDLTGTGSFPVEVTTSNGTTTSTITIQNEAPGFFMFDPADRKYIAGLTQDFKYLGNNLFPGTGLESRPAKPGEVVQLYGTGFGPTTTAVPAGRVFEGTSPLRTTPTATIGGQAATVQFAGLVGGGLYQINLVVPESLQDGDHQVVVTTNGVSTQQGAFISVKR
jgi:uncharacterized protein (TIGR03437 family)